MTLGFDHIDGQINYISISTWTI